MLGGHFHFTIKDKHGKVKDKYTLKNGLTAYGKELMLTSALTGFWFVGLIRTALANDPSIRVPPFDPIVINEHGWQEYTRYTGSRQPWVPVIVGGNASPVTPAQFTGFNEAMCPMGGAFLARTAGKDTNISEVFAFSVGGGSIVTLDDIVDVTYEINI